MCMGMANRARNGWILVDLGVTFPDMDGTPGVDLIFPDIQWLAERSLDLEAVFVTHAHEDHVGPWHITMSSWARPYTPGPSRPILRGRKMDEHGHPERAVHTVSAWEVVEKDRSKWGLCRFRTRSLKVRAW